LRFLEKRPLTVKFSKFCFKRFYRDTDRRVVFKFREVWPTEIGEIVRCLPDKKKQNFAWLSSCRYCSDRAQNLPRPAPDNVSAPDFIQIGSLSADYNRTLEHHQNAP